MKNWHFQLSYFHLYLSKSHKAKIEMESFYNVSLYLQVVINGYDNNVSSYMKRFDEFYARQSNLV